MKLAVRSGGLVACLVLLLAGAQASSKLRVPAVIVFGDSIVDPGNNNDINTVSKCNFPPYGKDFVGQTPTGRFSNGRIPGDLIASRLGIKEYLPAYLDADLSPEDLLTGVSFASGGAGYDPQTSRLASAISADQQLELFKEYTGKLTAIVGEEKAAAIVNNSLYLVCLGSDDVANTYFLLPLRKITYDLPSYATFIQGYASNFVQKLLDLGARKIGVVGLPPIGCVPSQRTMRGGIMRGCGAPLNQLATMINAKLDDTMRRFKAGNPEKFLVYADIYNIFLDIIQRPTVYGFEVTTRGCCGTGMMEVTYLCNSLTTTTCSDVSKYVFWDSFHPTEKGYKVIVDYLYEKYITMMI